MNVSTRFFAAQTVPTASIAVSVYAFELIWVSRF